MIDLRAAALAAQRSNAAYIEDATQSKAAFSALGDDWIDMIQGSDYQAVLSADSTGAAHLSISGTRASQLQLPDILDDAFLLPAHVSGGTVTAGVNSDQDRVWKWALQTVDKAKVINVAGHSLGGSRALLALAYCPKAQLGSIVSLAAPKFLQADFYKAYADELWRVVPVLNAADGWASWPWENPIWNARPPVEHIWLTGDASYELIMPEKWPGGLDFGDHDIGMYCQRLESIAVKS